MTHIFSNKAYNEDEEFAQIVLDTLPEANNLEHHMELIGEHYTDLTVVQLWTYEHSGMSIDEYQRCSFDSSSDAFAVTDNPEELTNRLDEINAALN